MTQKYQVNIDTPDTLEETLKLIKFIDAPRNRPPLSSKIGVSLAYLQVRESFIKDGRPSWRHGYDFKFWFDDLALAEEFVKLYPYAKIVTL